MAQRLGVARLPVTTPGSGATAPVSELAKTVMGAGQLLAVAEQGYESVRLVAGRWHGPGSLWSLRHQARQLPPRQILNWVLLKVSSGPHEGTRNLSRRRGKSSPSELL